ncbi:MAG: AsmA-like C-terminal region-containing protein, partial [Phyllobacteriaceae bacterium]|nr:AsmA-like C-terminal region-containing protein [Phyllobacteriaceae bacterium]
HLSVADRRFEAVIEKARAATKGREPSVDGFRFAVADIFVKPARGSVRLHVAGDTGSLAEIVDAEPLAALTQSGIAATGFTGTGSVTAQVDVAFTDPIDPNAIEYRVETQLDGFSAQQPIQGRRFQDGKFKIVADRNGLDVSGRAVVDGVPADLHVYDPHGSAKGNEKRDFKMEVDDAARQRLGIDLGGAVEGAIGLAVSQPDPNQLRSRIEADLTPARLNLTPLGWSKGPGVPAKATFDLWDDDKGIHVDNLALDSEGLSMRGNVLLDRDRNLVTADFSKFALRKGEAGKVKVTRGTDKAVTITFEGSSFDVRGLLQFSRRPPPQAQDAAKQPDLILKLKVGRVEGFNGVTVADVAVDGHWKAGAFQTLELRGRTGPRSPLSVAIRPEGGHRRFTVVSEDAGAVLSFLDLFDRIEAGKLTVSARLGAPGTSEGELRLVAFHLLEEPKSGRGVSSEQAADGTRRIAIRRAEIDRSTDFDRAQARFSMHDGIIDIVEGIAKGASVGATATGQLDVTAQRLSLSGTYIPAYGLNNLAGRIPIFGAITGAGSNEGLLGVTFRVGGPIADPILQINPLSAVAPGIFRRVFEFQREDMPQSSGDPNAPTNIMPDGAPTKITP